MRSFALRSLVPTVTALFLSGSAIHTTVNAQPFEKTEAAKPNIILQTTKSWDGSPLKYPSGQAQFTAVTLDLAPGANTGWHSHDAPSLVYVLDGSLDVVMKDGRVNHVRKGQSFAEWINEVHNARNVGTGTLKLLVIYTGVVGQKLLEKAE